MRRLAGSASSCVTLWGESEDRLQERGAVELVATKMVVMQVRDIGRWALAMRGLLSGRAGQIGPIVLLAPVAAYASILPQYDAGGIPRSTLIVLSALAVVPLAVAFRWPPLAAAASVLVTVVLVRVEYGPLVTVSLCVTVTLLVWLVVQRGLLVAAPLLFPFIVLAVVRLNEGTHSSFGSTAPLLFVLAAVVVGESLRRRGLATAALGATEEALAESARAQTMMEERDRIARELHDIVAHHLSVITVESEAARLASPELSSDVAGRLEAIASTAREALTETHRLLAVLREDTPGKADRTPQPGLAQLADLIDKARATGSHIRLVRQGTVVQLPRSIDLAAYRIVQESLTNARTHAPGADVDVEIFFRHQVVHLRVRDYGPGASSEPGVGHGLTGMRERARLAGGTFSSGQAEGGGFEVDVTLPIDETAA
jgi:signal transduction histidine kinase